MVTINRPSRRIKLLNEKGFRLKEYSPEKAGVGGSTPSLATTVFSLTYKPCVLRMCLETNWSTRNGPGRSRSHTASQHPDIYPPQPYLRPGRNQLGWWPRILQTLPLLEVAPLAPAERP